MTDYVKPKTGQVPFGFWKPPVKVYRMIRKARTTIRADAAYLLILRKLASSMNAIDLGLLLHAADGDPEFALKTISVIEDELIRRGLSPDFARPISAQEKKP